MNNSNNNEDVVEKDKVVENNNEVTTGKDNVVENDNEVTNEKSKVADNNEKADEKSKKFKNKKAFKIGVAIVLLLVICAFIFVKANLDTVSTNKNGSNKTQEKTKKKKGSSTTTSESPTPSESTSSNDATYECSDKLGEKIKTYEITNEDVKELHNNNIDFLDKMPSNFRSLSVEDKIWYYLGKMELSKLDNNIFDSNGNTLFYSGEEYITLESVSKYYKKFYNEEISEATLARIRSKNSVYGATLTDCPWLEYYSGNDAIMVIHRCGGTDAYIRVKSIIGYTETSNEIVIKEAYAYSIWGIGTYKIKGENQFKTCLSNDDFYFTEENVNSFNKYVYTYKKNSSNDWYLYDIVKEVATA